MRRDSSFLGLTALAAIACAGCDQLGLGPPQAASAPAAPSASSSAADSALRSHAGETYSNFVAEAGARYAPDALGMTAGDRARVWRGMATHASSQLVTGGGAEALVFRGCAEAGCGEGATIVAIDTATGAPFVGVRDVGGADVITPNDRVEALLRLNSPNRRWDDADVAETRAP